MKIAEIKNMSSEDLGAKLSDFKSELLNLRFQLAINQLENPMRIKAVKKDVARIKTILNERNKESKSECEDTKEGVK
ncbi:MAG: 50S ribosomal protein L29 [Oscillospiraceae bacterium]|jgi:large subunit ribosomal protein L29|nr:50S ribosomal protein L29 [Oscillospiraceae bacterium]